MRHHAVNDDIGRPLVNLTRELATADNALNVVCRHLLHATSLQSRLAERALLANVSIARPC